MQNILKFPALFGPQMICQLQSEFGLLKISGLEASKLLQGQLTCDIEKLSSGQTRMGAHCNPQGRIISLFYINKFNDDYYLFMLRSLIPIALTALQKYAVFYRVLLEDISDKLMIIGLTNKEAANQSSLISFCVSGQLPRYVIALEKAMIAPIWNDLAKQNEVTDTSIWQHQNIIDGIPLLYPNTSEKFLPHDIHLHRLGAIDFDKGCYTGQEIIARMHYRGKLKNHLYRTCLTSVTPLYPGQDMNAHPETEINGTLVNVSLYKNNEYNVLIVTDETTAKNNLMITV